MHIEFTVLHENEAGTAFTNLRASMIKLTLDKWHKHYACTSDYEATMHNGKLIVKFANEADYTMFALTWAKNNYTIVGVDA